MEWKSAIAKYREGELHRVGMGEFLCGIETLLCWGHWQWPHKYEYYEKYHGTMYFAIPSHRVPFKTGTICT